MKNIYLILGPSGVGKSTLTAELQKKHGYSPVSSYTDRPARYPGEQGHTFVSSEDFDKYGPFVAYTVFDGHRYGVPAKMIDTNDVYVVDPAGKTALEELYKGNKSIKSIYLYANETELRQRMKRRGDSDEAITRRLTHDKRIFANVDCDITLHADGIPETANTVAEFIKYCERK